MSAQSSPGAEAKPSLFTRPFVLLCLVMFLGFSNQWVILPVIPLYVKDLGGSAFLAGVALLAFAFPSVAVRPYIGRLADRWGATVVLGGGLILLTIGSLGLLLPILVMSFVGLFVRGVGWAGFNTGGYTVLAKAAPAERRGEAAGYYTSATASATIFFPALGLWLIDGRGGYFAVFLVAALLTAIALPIGLRLEGKRAAFKGRSAQGAGAAPASLIDRSVLVATGLNLCATLTTPSVMAFLPLYARELGIEHIGAFYVVVGVTGIVVRPILGQRSDAMGRGPSVAFGLGAQFIGLLLIFLAEGLALILAGGLFVAVGWAMVGSATTALAMDLANAERRGQAMATYSLSFQLGAGTGSILSGALADLTGLRGMYVGSLVITTIGIGILAWSWKALPRPPR